MKVSIKDLELLYNLINEKLCSLNSEEVELASDYYWFISPDEREDLKREPSLCVGSLDDDWKELKKVLITRHVTLVDLDRYANVLIALGEKLSKKNNI